MSIDDILTALTYIFCFYVLFYIGKRVHDILHREYDLTHELVVKDNPALALAVAGYYFGMVLAIGGAIAGPSNGILDDLIDMGIYGILAIVLLNISWYVCDRIILGKFRVSDELIRDQNSGTGAVCFGVSVASGMMVFGAVTGNGGTIWTAMGFWLAGQVLMTLAAWLYAAMIPYDLHGEIEKDNVAAGVGFSGALIAMGVIVGSAASRDFIGWAEDLPAYGGMAACGLVMLPVARFLTEKLLLPTVRLSDEIAAQEKPNVGAAYIEALSYVGASFVISWCL